MYITFYLVFMLGSYPMAWIESGQEFLMSVVGRMWPETVLPLGRSLLIDGIMAGVGGVVVFLPNIVLLFLALSLLEGTGYMARGRVYHGPPDEMDGPCTARVSSRC